MFRVRHSESTRIGTAFAELLHMTQATTPQKTYPIHHLTPLNTPPAWAHLWNVPEPPQELFIQCTPEAYPLLGRLPDDGLAIVGTRNPQASSIALLKPVIHDLTKSHLIVLSGLARGIDSAAHHFAIQNQIPTIALLGAGLHQIYPQENQTLAHQILESNGLLISEFPLHSRPLGYHFLKRNRLIAGWSKATWVVEASFRSGALNTARWARDQNKICLATPCFPGNPHYAGNQILLDRDHALCFWNTSSLGAAWLELSTLCTRPRAQQPTVKTQPLHTFESRLLQKVHTETTQSGGIPVTSLLDWSLDQAYTPHQFYETLSHCIQENNIILHQGLLAAHTATFESPKKKKLEKTQNFRLL